MLFGQTNYNLLLLEGEKNHSASLEGKKIDGWVLLWTVNSSCV